MDQGVTDRARDALRRNSEPQEFSVTPPPRPVHTLIVDNYDSYTYNLYAYLCQVNGEGRTDVVFNDKITPSQLRDLLKSYDNVVISPGPGRPGRQEDFGVCKEVLEQDDVPVLGVCLGLQGMVHYAGGTVTSAKEVMHGRLSPVDHEGKDIFSGIPSPMHVIRYHSLVASEAAMPDTLRITARSVEEDGSDGVVMGIQHLSKPQWAVQFHPESICTENGLQLIENFRDLALQFNEASGRKVEELPDLASLPFLNPWSRETIPKETSTEEVITVVRPLGRHIDAEAAFMQLYGDKAGRDSDECVFWLDSSKLSHGSRFSFMGALSPDCELLQYDSISRELSISTKASGSKKSTGESGDILNYMRNSTSRLTRLVHEDNSSCLVPFDFHGGYIGYLGYEMRHICENAFVSGHINKEDLDLRLPPYPCSQFMFADKFVAFDHNPEDATKGNDVYLLSVAPAGDYGRATAWFDSVEAQLEGVGGEENADSCRPGHIESQCTHDEVEFDLHHPEGAYVSSIRECLNMIQQGETYELCLTNRITTKSCPDPLSLHRRLRRQNAAPYGAFIQLPGMSIVSASPERFLRVNRHGIAEAKPIKGTVRRGETEEEDKKLKSELGSNIKDFAENLMITDLLRNDLTRMCDPVSICVPRLMNVESYATVHQLVTTIRGEVGGRHAADVVRAAFPPGSMTGAPKHRSLEILDRIEGTWRGAYSGALGYFGLGGTSDLSVVIRTAILTENETAIGAGGAIIALSDENDEFDEMMLKARALLQAIAMECGKGPTDYRVHGLCADFDAETYLESVSHTGIRPGTEAIQSVLSCLGDPQLRVPIIHVTGTNGKGSVCAYLEQALLAAGYKVGKFTSPHLVSWRESIMVNNTMISKSDFAQVIQQVVNITEKRSRPASQFEVLTAAAFLHFAESGCDINVVEVGVGGREDATNVCPETLCSVIVSISTDHTALLGKSNADIAFHKSGIFKAGSPAVVGPISDPSAKDIITREAARVGCSSLEWIEPARLVDSSSNTMESCGIAYAPSLMGDFQRCNSAVAIAAMKAICRSRPDIAERLTDDRISAAMGKATWHGRLESRTYRAEAGRVLPLIIDGAHNAGSAKALGQYCEEKIRIGGQRVTFVLGMIQGKDHQGVLAELLRPGDHVFTVPIHARAPWLSSAPPEYLKEVALSVCPGLGSATHCDSLDGAMERVAQQASSEQKVVLCGSLYLIGNFLNLPGSQSDQSNNVPVASYI